MMGVHGCFDVVAIASHEGDVLQVSFILICLSVCLQGQSPAYNEAMVCLGMIMRVSADVRENSHALTGRYRRDR